MGQPGARRHDGLLLLDKPAGPTSFRVVTRARAAVARALGLPASAVRGGHAGTLDPLATGLMIVLLGAGTRLAPFLVGLDKRYRVRARFGAGTDTDDAEGRVTARRPVAFGPDELAAALARFRGASTQLPPPFSAVKSGGRPLHRLARAGRELPPLAPRPIVVTRLELLATSWGAAPVEPPAVDSAPAEPATVEPRPVEPAAAEPPAAAPAPVEQAAAAPAPSAPAEPPLAPDGLVYEAELTLDCSSGTYVRALVRDLAAALGSAGHVRALRRLRVGPFVVEDALAGEALDDPATVADAVRPPAAALPHLPGLTLDDDEARAVRHGGQPRPEWLARLRPPAWTPSADGVERAGEEAAGGGTGPADAGLPGAHGPDPGWFAMVDADGALLAVGRRDAGDGRPALAAVFAPAEG